MRCVFFCWLKSQYKLFSLARCKNIDLNWHEPHQCFFNHLTLSSIQGKNGSQRKKWQHFRMRNDFFRFLSSFQCEYNFQFNRLLCEYNFQYSRFVCLGGYIPSENWKTTSFLSSFFQKVNESRKNLKVFLKVKSVVFFLWNEANKIESLPKPVQELKKGFKLGKTLPSNFCVDRTQV